MKKISFIFILTFLSTYALLAIFLWLYANISSQGMLGTKQSLVAFSRKYEKVLKNDVFESLFQQAQTCTSIELETKKIQCREMAGKRLGDILREEELATKEGYNWPNDLFFVKQKGNIFLRLGWDGEIRDISSTVNKELLQAPQPDSSLLFIHNCNYFNSYPADTRDACEMYAALSLSQASTGYIVRLHPQVEEEMLVLYFLSPLLLMVQLQSLPYAALVDYWFIALLFFHLLLPLIIAFSVVFFYKKRYIPQRHKH